MTADLPTVEVAAVATAAVAVLSLAICLLLASRLNRLRRAYDRLVGADGDGSFVDAVRRQATTAEGLRRDVALLRDDLSAARADLSDALRHVAVVRYDAFGDMGGRLSFSAALLDDAGDGLVLTSINGRSETRTYAKGVQAGSSDRTMSPEELQAIAYATKAERQPDEAPLSGGARRSRRGARG